MLLKEIYQTYAPLPTLQQHMLRVGAIVSIILNNTDENFVHNTGFTKNDLIVIALLHDIAKIVEMNLETTVNFFPQYTKEEIEQAKIVQQKMQKEFGQNHSCAATLIFDKLRLPAEYSAVQCLIKFRYAYFVYKNKIYPNYIINYADQRVSPHGTTTLIARFLEGQKRYMEKTKRLKDTVNFDSLYQKAKLGELKELPYDVYANDWIRLQFTSLLKIEKFIFAKIIKNANLRPAAITEDLVQQEIQRQNFLEWEIEPAF